MKSLAKLRKQEEENNLRDAKAFSVILWFVLNAISGKLNYGPKRLQRLYDDVLELMHSNREDLMIGYILEDWAIKNGLTEKDYFERRKSKES